MFDSRSRRIVVIFAVVLTAALALPAAAQAPAAGKRSLALDDYEKWSRITSTAISPDGAWIAYALDPNRGETKLFFKNPETGKVYETTGGSRPIFSDDSAWAACLISPSDEERERLQKANQPVVVKAELRNLATGDAVRYDNAQAVDFTPGGAFFTLKKAKVLKDAKHGGTDLILRNLKTGAEENIGNAGAFAVNKPGTALAYAVDAADQAGNGFILLALGTGIRTIVDSGAADYAQLAWDEAGTAAAVLKGTKKKGFTRKENVLIAVRDAGAASPKVTIYDPAADKSFPSGMVLSELGALRWNKAATMVFCGLKENEPESEKPKDPKEKQQVQPPTANVDVWHYADEQIQSVQMQRAAQERNRTWMSVVHLDPLKFVRLTDESMRQVLPNEDGRVVIGSDPKPYLSDLNWGGAPADYYLVDTLTGRRTHFENKIARSMGLSPDGRWFLYLKDKQVLAVNLAIGRKANLTAVSPVSFIDVEDDHPYELPTYGVAGWAKDGSAVILNHRYDLWSLPLPGGKPVNITGGIGTKEHVRFRYLSTDPEERFIDTSKPLLLSAFDERTKASGFASLEPGGGKPVRLLFGDRATGRPTKAKSADRFLFSSGTFVDFPDYFVSDGSFAAPKKVTDANPQQAEFAWGSRTLIDFKNRKGQKLQAILTLPAGYEKGKRYPMIVYFYERLSDTFHQYSMPTYDDRPHFSFYASNGYLVLQPDIVYEIGKPGTSALDCVTSATRAAIDLGYADPKRIGIQGHSWGGYETSYIATQTDMFACVVTGAPPTNLISFYDELYKSTGTNQSGITERGQVRMGVSPWDDFKLYEDQSAIYSAAKIKQPILILHGTADGAVDWHQGLELYNAGRRLGKKIILLSYPDEQHHLTKKENQIDFQVRMRQFFDHYLKGAPAPDWIAKGVPFLKKKS